MKKFDQLITLFYRLTLPVLPVFILLRIYEYYTATSKLNVNCSKLLIWIWSLVYDVYTWFFLCLILILPFAILWFIKPKIAKWFALIINGIIILCCFSLQVVYSERLTPFDHEFFIRSSSETWETLLSVLGGRTMLILPVIFYIAGYYLLYNFYFSKRQIHRAIPISFVVLGLVAIIFPNQIKQNPKKFCQMTDYYSAVNKIRYWTTDSYTFLYNKKFNNLNNLSQQEIDKEIEFYQSINHFRWVDKEYPFLHFDDSKNVLKDYFNESTTQPNIVIIIYEGLSRDFSGPDAECGSWTPFLDSLSEHSLSWYNCLSTAQGTFGSLPALTGSLPFGNKGFTLMTQPPEHISLIKILKKNNWNAFYFIGGTVNFDNFGGYMRLQGIDYISNHFGKKYKPMGPDESGWTLGYPDEALFSKSLDVLDSIKSQKYLSVYLTLTTHTPFIFDEKEKYEKLFEAELQKRKISDAQKSQLRKFSPMFSSFMYSDNAMRNFFARYKNRPEFKNTIFIIAGDHHHFYYPTRTMIDDYNVPLVIYSPLLKKAQRFESVNSHFNITPTVLALLKGNYHLQYYPRVVSFIGDVLDTCRTFRNIHHLPFMLTSRDINDYLYDDYYIVDGMLEKLKPGLNLDDIDDNVLTAKYKRILDNFKILNNYVCQNNKLYPESENIYDNTFEMLAQMQNDSLIKLTPNSLDYKTIATYKPPSGLTKIKIEISFEIRFKKAEREEIPQIITSISSKDEKTRYLKSNKEIREIIDITKTDNDWTKYVDEDIFDIQPYNKKGECSIKVELWNLFNLNTDIRNFKIKYSVPAK